MWSTFLRLSETHKRRYGNDIQETWAKIKQMIENKKVPESIADKAAKLRRGPEKSKREYEKSWNEFLAFMEKDDEATEEDYMKYITYLAEEKHHKAREPMHM